MLAATKMLQNMFISGGVNSQVGIFLCNLCCNKIARQIAGEIAQCSSTFRKILQILTSPGMVEAHSHTLAFPTQDPVVMSFAARVLK